MPSWCLVPKKVDDFKQAILDGEINPDKLAAMSSAERRAFFTEKFGEADAEELNRRLETKLLLKDQQAGLVRWAEDIIAPKEIKRDLISRIKRMGNVLDAETEQAFFNDLASYRLGTRVSHEQAQQIMQMSQATTDAQEAMEQGERRGYNEPPTETELDYGRKAVALMNYVNDLKQDARKTTLEDVKKNPASTVLKGVVAIPGAAKGMRASLDNSAVFRQGWKVMFTNPLIWKRNGLKTFSNIWNTFGGKPVMDEINAGIISDPNYSKMQKAKLDVMSGEEDFPTALPQKIPYYRRAYKAAETAYTGFQHKNRADIFNKMLEIADKTGARFSEQDLVNVGRMVNALTGRGYLGNLEQAGQAINTVFFSPKFLKSQIDILTQPVTGGATAREAAEGTNKGSNFVRKQAFGNLAKIVLGQAALFALIRAFLPDDDLELDPRSSDFGKLRIGKTRFDLTGGMGSLATLAARIATGESKSTTSGKMTNLRDPEYGARNIWDVITDFFGNKLSPVGQVAKDVATQKTFEGTRPTVAGEAKNLTVPMLVDNLVDAYNLPDTPDELKVASVLADALGVSSKTYKPFPKKETKPRTWKETIYSGWK